MPFGLLCVVCNQPFLFFENFNLTLRALQRCTECDQRLQGYQEDILVGMEQDFESSGITAEIEAFIYGQLEELAFPSDLREPIEARLSYLRLLSRICEGDFPHVAYAGHRDTDEYAHFHIATTYINSLGKKVKKVPGKLLGTTRKLYFLPESGVRGHEIGWSSIKEAIQQKLRLEEEEGETIRKNVVVLSEDEQSSTYRVLRIRVTSGSGGGDYALADPLLVKTFIDALIKQWRRQSAAKRSTSSYVPDAIKAVVYQRDGGRCMECGYEGPYIQYDHVFPRSKGGLTNVENIQLLCGMCNLKKGNRV